MEKRYTDSHEWIAIEGDIGTVGITEYAKNELGEVVYLELPEVGRSVSKGDDSVVLESTKAAADVYAPVSGKIMEINEKLLEAQDALQESPEKEGWLYKILLADRKEFESLMNEEEYRGNIK